MSLQLIAENIFSFLDKSSKLNASQAISHSIGFVSEVYPGTT